MPATTAPTELTALERRQARLARLDDAIAAEIERRAEKCGNPADYFQVFRAAALAELILELCAEDNALLEKLEIRFLED